MTQQFAILVRRLPAKTDWHITPFMKKQCALLAHDSYGSGESMRIPSEVIHRILFSVS